MRASLAALGLPFPAAVSAAISTTRHASAVRNGTSVATETAASTVRFRAALSSSVAFGRRYAAITAS